MAAAQDWIKRPPRLGHSQAQHDRRGHHPSLTAQPAYSGPGFPGRGGRLLPVARPDSQAASQSRRCCVTASGLVHTKPGRRQAGCAGKPPRHQKRSHPPWSGTCSERAIRSGQSWSPPVGRGRIPQPLAAPSGQSRRTSSWSCEFDSRHPLHHVIPNQGQFRPRPGYSNIARLQPACP